MLTCSLEHFEVRELGQAFGLVIKKLVKVLSAYQSTFFNIWLHLLVSASWLCATLGAATDGSNNGYTWKVWVRVPWFSLFSHCLYGHVKGEPTYGSLICVEIKFHFSISLSVSLSLSLFFSLSFSLPCLPSLPLWEKQTHTHTVIYIRPWGTSSSW